MAAKIESIDINGIKVPLIYEEDKRLPLVTTQIVFTNAGSITDEKIAGLARFSASLLNNGTKKLGSNGFSEQLESRAISISASAGKETFVLEVSSLKDEYKSSIKYLDELLLDPNYTKESISKIKTMTLGSISRRENNFDYVASNALKSILFKGTVLAQPSSGTVDSVKKISLKNVKSFVEEYLVLSRAIVVVGGDISIKEIKKNISKVLKRLPIGVREDVPYYEVVKTPGTSIITKDTQQAYIYFGSPYNLKIQNKDLYKAKVATFILGTGGFGSRLMEEIRVKKGLAYSAYARLHVSKSSSYMSGYLQTKLDSMDEAKVTVEKVISEFVKNGVTQDELDQTKKFLLGSEPLRVETMSQRLNRTFMEYYNGFNLGHSTEELEKIKALKLEDLNQYIKKHKEILKLSFAIVKK